MISLCFPVSIFLCSCSLVCYFNESHILGLQSSFAKNGTRIDALDFVMNLLNEEPEPTTNGSLSGTGDERPFGQPEHLNGYQYPELYIKGGQVLVYCLLHILQAPKDLAEYISLYHTGIKFT